MHRILASLLMVVLAAACRTTSAPTCGRDGPASEVLREFQVAEEEALLPLADRAEDPGFDRFYTAMAEPMRTLVASKLLPHRKLLHEHARWNLACLPRRPLPDTTGWTVRLDEDTAPLWETLSASSLGVDLAALKPVFAWDPVRVAHVVRPVIESRGLRPVSLGLRSIVRSFAPPEIVAIDPDERHPVVGWIGPREVFLVDLVRTEDGDYRPSHVRWFLRK